LAKVENILQYRRDGEFYLRRAERCLNEEDPEGALAHLRRGLKAYPHHDELRLMLADALSLLGAYDRSNRILLRLLDEKGKDGLDCAYYLGHNLMNMGEYHRALSMLKRYLEGSEKGIYVEDAVDMVRSIEEYLEELQNLSEGEQLADEGKFAMDEGDYGRAISLFQKALTLDKSLLYVRNNLSICYYALGEFEKGLYEVESVYKVEPDNLFCNCNLLLFYQVLGRYEDYTNKLDEIAKLKPQNEQDAIRLGLALGENKRDEDAYRIFKEGYNQYGPIDHLLYYLGIAAYNSGNYDAAFKHFEALMAQEWENSVARYYRSLSAAALKGEEPLDHLSYQYQVPMLEAAKRVNVLNEVMRKGPDAIKEAFETDGEFKSYVLWGVELLEPRVRGACIEILSVVNSIESIEVLRGMLLSSYFDDGTKQQLLMALHRCGAKEPYLAYMGGEVVKAQLSVFDFPLEGEEFYRSVLDLIVKKMGQYKLDHLADDMVALLCDHLRSPNAEKLQALKPKDVAAALCYLCAKGKGLEFYKKDACEIFETYYTGLSQALTTLSEEAFHGHRL